MSRIAFVADVHVGNHARMGGPIVHGINSRARFVLDSLTLATKKAASLGCDAFVVLGDLFDNVRPEPQLIAATADALRAVRNDNELLPVYLLLGNHEQCSTEKGDNALAPLGRMEHCTVIDTTPVERRGNVDIILCPYQCGNGSEWLSSAVEYLSGYTNGLPYIVIATHLGVKDGRTPAFLQNAHDSIKASDLAKLCKKFGAEFAFTGNWHEQRQWDIDGVRIHQCGALVPTGFDNPSIDPYGTMHILDTDARTPHVAKFTIPGPRFVKVQHEREVHFAIKECRAEGSKLFIEYKEAPENEGKASELLSKLQLQGFVQSFSVITNDKDLKAKARLAASSARDADTLAQALVAFVEAMPLSAGVNRREVLERAQDYMRRKH